MARRSDLPAGAYRVRDPHAIVRGVVVCADRSIVVFGGCGRATFGSLADVLDAFLLHADDLIAAGRF